MSYRGILAWVGLLAVVVAGCSQSTSNTPATSGEGAASAGTETAAPAKQEEKGKRENGEDSRRAAAVGAANATAD